MNLRGFRFAAAIEGLKDMRQVLRGNAQPTIPHRQGDLRGLNAVFHRRLQTDPTALAAVFFGVVEQVLQRLSQGRRIGLHRGQAGGDVRLQLKSAFGQQRLIRRDELFQLGIELQGLQFARGAARLHPREFEDLFDHFVQLARLFADDLAVLLHLFGAARHARG